MATPAQQYLAFVFTDVWVAAVLWQQISGKVTVLAQSQPIQFRSHKDNDMNQSVDAALDELGEAGLSLKTVLFAVPTSWTENGDLLSQRKRFLHGLTQDLVLEPMGFVVLTDTLLAAELAQTGKEFSGIMITHSKQFWDIAHFHNGEEKNAVRVGVSEDINADLEEVQAQLKELDTKQRILYIALWPDMSLDERSQVAALFSNHTEIIAAPQIIDCAITLGGAEVLNSLHGSSAVHTEAVVAATGEAGLGFSEPDFAHASTPAPEEAIAPELIEATEVPVLPFTVRHASAEFVEPGPLMNKKPILDAEIVEEESNFSVNNLNSDGSFTQPDWQEEGSEEISELEALPAKKRKNPLAFLTTFSFPRLPKIGGFKNAKKKPLLMGVAVVVLLGLIGGGYVFALQTYSAKVDIWLKAAKLETTAEFLIGASANASASAARPIDGEVFTQEVAVEKEVTTTGAKIIGDPAKGKIRLFNKTGQKKVFPSGTQAKAGSLIFTFDTEVEVASASTKEDSSRITTTTPGTAEVGVTAVGIGPDGNLAKEVSLSVANFDASSYEASTVDVFSGGASREIQAVAQKDIDGAVKELTQQAKDQLAEAIKTEKNDTGFTLATNTFKVVSTQPSIKVGEESKFVTVKLTAATQGIRMKTDDVIANTEKLLQDQVAQDQQLLAETVSIEPEKVTTLTGNTVFAFTAKISGQAVPQVSASDLIQPLLGEYVSRATTVLKEDSRIARTEISIQPSWAQWLFTRLPSNINRVNTNIRIER